MTEEKAIVKIELNPSDLPLLVKEGSKAIYNPKADEATAKLLKYQAMIDEAVKKVKQLITDDMYQLDPDIKSIVSEKVKITFRQYGTPYVLSEEGNPDYEWLEEKGLIKKEEKVSWKIDTKKVREYLKEHGELPEGIGEIDRPKQVSLKLQEEKE